MTHKTDAKENANRIVAMHQANGLTPADARKAAIVSVECLLGALSTRNMTHSLYMRTLNYLNDKSNFLKYPKWFTPVVQGVVRELWLENKPGENLRMASLKYMQEEAMKNGEQIFIADAMDLIKSTVE
jgi:hypothetical protein